MFSFTSAAERSARRYTLCIPAKRAIFTYIPKNACSTLRYSIAIANGRPDSVETANYMHNGMAEMIATPQQLANCTYAFTVLRCPYRRIASAFLDKAVSDESRARSLLPRERRLFCRRSSSANQTSAAIAQAKIRDLSFADFLDLLQKRKSSWLDPHFRTQTEFLLKRGYDDYFALEQLTEAEGQLREKIGLRLIDKGGHGVSRRKKSDINAASLSIGELLELRASGYAPTYDSLFTPTTQRAVETFYANDLALYKKQFGSEGLLFPG
jgi:hypothetical protein